MTIIFAIGAVLVGLLVLVGLGALFAEPFEMVFELLFGWTDLVKGRRARDKDIAPRTELARQLRLKATDASHDELTGKRPGGAVVAVRWLRAANQTGVQDVTTVVSIRRQGLATHTATITSPRDLDDLLWLGPHTRAALSRLLGPGESIAIDPASATWTIPGDKIAEGFLRQRLDALEALGR